MTSPGLTDEAAVVLLVEPDRQFGETLVTALSEALLRVVHLGRGRDAIDAVAATPPQLIVVDVQLPDISVIDLCAALRHHCSAPILVVNATRRRVARQRIWDAGVDAYVDDPSRDAEIRARARALLRRANSKVAANDETLEFGAVRVDLKRRTVRVGGQPIRVSPKELQVLEVLVRAQGRVVPRQVLFDRVWGKRSAPDLRTLETHIARLRKKLEVDGRPRTIVTVPERVGFKLITVPGPAAGRGGPQRRSPFVHRVVGKRTSPEGSPGGSHAAECPAH